MANDATATITRELNPRFLTVLEEREYISRHSVEFPRL